ncbi:hypothetical protein C8Q78DRAFT_514194 [Trametes maxima]|nr:hypothetical protein C8Q78DRAFT_514194 [Trametes maxima]
MAMRLCDAVRFGLQGEKRDVGGIAGCVALTKGRPSGGDGVSMFTSDSTTGSCQGRRDGRIHRPGPGPGEQGSSKCAGGGRQTDGGGRTYGGDRDAGAIEARRGRAAPAAACWKSWRSIIKGESASDGCGRVVHAPPLGGSRSTRVAGGVRGAVMQRVWGEEAGAYDAIDSGERAHCRRRGRRTRRASGRGRRVEERRLERRNGREAREDKIRGEKADKAAARGEWGRGTGASAV